MQLGQPKKKWRITRLSPDYRDEERIGTLIEGADFWLFAQADPKRDTIHAAEPCRTENRRDADV